MKRQEHDAFFFERIQKEIDQTGKEMVLCVVRYMNQELVREEFLEKMNEYCEHVEEIRKEERQVLDVYGRIIKDIQNLTK